MSLPTSGTLGSLGYHKFISNQTLIAPLTKITQNFHVQQVTINDTDNDNVTELIEEVLKRVVLLVSDHAFKSHLNCILVYL